MTMKLQDHSTGKAVCEGPKEWLQKKWGSTTLEKSWALRGTAPPTPKLACFVLYLKIINTFLKNNICILY